MSPITDPAVEAYLEAHTSAPTEALAALAAETRETLPAPQMLTGTVEGRFLELLVWAARPRLVLELGTFSGYSALSMAPALPEGGRIVTCEVSDVHADVAQRHIDQSPHAASIEIRRGPALETIADLDGPFDLVFIDADKPGYVAYYDAVLPKLGERGLILADNTLWSGRVADPSDTDERTEGMRAFNEHVRADTRVVSVMLSVRDGITLIRRV
ncbi:MAG: O-methyltransferase [Solirubrobacteraceae bacterium]